MKNIDKNLNEKHTQKLNKAHRATKRVLVRVTLIGILILTIGIGFFVLNQVGNVENQAIPLKVTEFPDNSQHALQEIKLKNPQYENKDLDAVFNEEDFNEKVLDFKLKSHNSVDEIKQVGAGKQVVMFYDVNSQYGLSKALGEVEFTDMKTGELVERDYRYVYWGNESYESPIYSCETKTSSNGTAYEDCTQTGTETKTREAWLDYNSRDIPKGHIRIGIEVEVLVGDWIDGVWTVGGKKIDRHAQFKFVLQFGGQSKSESRAEARGYKFTPIVDDMTSFIVQRNTSDTSNQAELWLRTGSAVGNSIENVSVDGSGNFTFSESAVSKLNSSNTYFVTISSGGSNRISTYNDTGVIYPRANSHINVESAVRLAGGNAEFSNRYESIFRIYTVNDTIDTLTVTLLSPEDNANLTSQDVDFIGNVSDPNSVNITNVTIEVWNTDDNTLDYTDTNTSTIEGNYTWTATSLIDGNYNWTVSAYDGSDTEYNSSTRTFNIDTTPTINISSPTNTTYSTSSIWFNATSDLSVDYWIINYNGTNHSITDQTGLSLNELLTVEDGNHQLLLYGNNSDSGVLGLNDTIYFTVNLTEPTVTLLEPVNDIQTGEDPLNFTAGLTAGNYILNNATISVWYENGTLFKQETNTSISGTSDTNVTYSLPDFETGNFLWNVEVHYENTDLGTFNTISADNNFSLRWVPFTVDGETYSNATFETKNESFMINITTATNVENIGAFLTYDSNIHAADHTCISGFCEIDVEIDIPLLSNQALNSENKTFKWSITLFGDFGTFSANSTEHEQNVSNINFTSLASGNSLAVTFETYNESDLQPIQTDFDATFNYYLGSGSVSEDYNFSSSGATSYDFYIDEPTETFYVNSTIDISNSTQKRHYFFQKANYTNTTTTKELFIPYTDTTAIIIELKDQGLVPLESYLGEIYRSYPSLNQNKLIASQLTDEFGQFVEKLLENDAKYTFKFYNSNNVLKKTSKDITIACRSSICVVPFVLEEDDGDFERFDNLTLFDYDFSFNNNTNTFSVLWDDQRQQSSTVRLEVTRYQLNQSAIVCNSTSTSKVSSLTCAVGAVRASYRAQLFRTVTGETENRIALLNVQVGNPFSTLGVEGLLWVFILLFTGIGLGAFNPAFGAGIYGVGFLIFGLMGMISMPLPVFFANTLLVVIFIWLVKT